MKLSRRTILQPITFALLSATLNMQAFASSPIGGVTLLNKDNVPCSFPPPAEGSGETSLNSTFDPNQACYLSGTRNVRFDRLPSAMEIIFSSRFDCKTDLAKEDEYWIKFKTIATNTGSPNIYSFEELQNYPTGQTLFRGLKLVDKKAALGEKMRDATTCVKFIASGTVNTPEPTKSLTLKDTKDTITVKENDDKEAFCPGSSMIYYRKHEGDENENTTYKCRTAENYAISNRTWSEWIRESGRDPEKTSATPSANDKRYIFYTCPTNTVMTGRHHDGDENGDTRYQCASLVDSKTNLPVLVEPSVWSSEQKESSSTAEECPTDQVMIGRAHKNDENGETRYVCATLIPTAQ